MGAILCLVPVPTAQILHPDCDLKTMSTFHGSLWGNKHGDIRFFFQLFAKNSLIKNIFEKGKKFENRTWFFLENSSVLGAVTKSRTGTLDVGLGRWTGTLDWDVGLGRWTWDSGTWDARTRGRAATRGRDKQTTPDICAEFVEYNFLWSRESYFTRFTTFIIYYFYPSLSVVADDFQRPWFGRTCLFAYLTVRTLGTE